MLAVALSRATAGRPLACGQLLAALGAPRRPHAGGRRRRSRSPSWRSRSHARPRAALWHAASYSRRRARRGVRTRAAGEGGRARRPGGRALTRDRGPPFGVRPATRGAGRAAASARGRQAKAVALAVLAVALSRATAGRPPGVRSAMRGAGRAAAPARERHAK